MKRINITTSLILIGLISYSSLTYSAKSSSLADIISNQVFDVRLADRCGDVIPADRKAYDRCKKQTGGPEKFPPIASEACAYDRIGDELKLSFDEAQMSDDEVATYINVYDEEKVKIYDNKIDQLPFVLYEKKKRVESWPLTNQTGASLQVGRQGKKYTVQIERRKLDDVTYTTGIMDVFVDDCELRNQKIVSMISDPSIEHTPGFDLYLELLNSVSTKICNKIKTGLLGASGVDTFSQRCRYQCINNSFTNELINQAYASTDTLLARTHKIVRTKSANALASNLWMENVRISSALPNGWFKPRGMLINYVNMEDELRAGGYFKCDGPINSSDRNASVVIIRESTTEILSGLEAFIGEKIIRTIDFHLDRTEGLYLKLP